MYYGSPRYPLKANAVYRAGDKILLQSGNSGWRLPGARVNRHQHPTQEIGNLLGMGVAAQAADVRMHPTNQVLHAIYYLSTDIPESIKHSKQLRLHKLSALPSVDPFSSNILKAYGIDAPVGEAPTERWRSRATDKLTRVFGGRTYKAMALISDAAGQVLEVKNIGGEGWVPPGGGVKRREDPEAAAARELKEETGIEADWIPPENRKVGGQVIPEPNGVVTSRSVIRFREGMAKGNPKLTGDVKAAEWISEANLPETSSAKGDLFRQILPLIHNPGARRVFAALADKARSVRK